MKSKKSAELYGRSDIGEYIKAAKLLNHFKKGILMKYLKDKKANIHIRSTINEKKEWAKAAKKLSPKMTLTGYIRHLHLMNVSAHAKIS